MPVPVLRTLPTTAERRLRTNNARLRPIVAEWVGDANPYVRRAAVAAICEPRLLTDPATRTAALQACRRASESITTLSATERKTPGVRNLRQALGYCWSVAVVADPDEGMPAFERLRAVDDPDIRWIVASNLKKSRLRRQLASRWTSTAYRLNQDD